MKNKKILKILIPCCNVLLIFAVIGKKAGWFGKAATVKVAVEYAEKRLITETITANGKIQPEKEVKITPDVSGEIVELTVKEGDQSKRDSFFSGSSLIFIFHRKTVQLLQSALHGPVLHRLKPSLPRLNYHIKEPNSCMRNRQFQNQNLNRPKPHITLQRQKLMLQNFL